MPYQRLLNKGKKPSSEEIISIIGKKSSLWLNIHDYIGEKYDFTSELVFWTKKYGWTIRYKKGSRTFGYFFPEEEAFSVLIVLGRKEVEKVELAKLNKKVKSIFKTTEQLHDGRWLWIRVLEKSDVECIKEFLHAKRKPKKRKMF